MSGPEVQPILDSAERAASSGDYAHAESLLREVARLQAESLGPKHPDLASTFNNLGVVCERTNKLMDAGRFYREALSIASESLQSEDPLVATSRHNFNEFHRGLGLVEIEPAHDRDIVTTIPTSSELPRQAIVAGIAIGVALLGAVAIWFTRAPATQPTAEKTTIVDKRLSQFGDPLVPDMPSVPVQDSHPSPPPSTETIVVRPAPAAKAVPARLTIPTPPEVDAQVLEASLCQTLSTAGGRWECTPTPGLAAGDLLYFYTRIASSTSVRIHHRWYRNGTLRQDVGLVVQPNPSAGYRTYSQRRLETGDWRIAVVGADGQVLREETVEVR
jgi:Protein of unknown function (DUF2914)/Tetratricopeptide repeat